jgi:signal peptidase I
MFGFLKPRFVKDAEMVLKNARKLLCYRRDLLAGDDIAGLEAQMGELREAAKARNRAEVSRATALLEKKFLRHFPPLPDAGWRENCEVFLVAIVIAFAFRTYFLQPFTIPTGSMQPTLSGIIGYPTVEPPPNFLVRVMHWALLGRSYVDVVAKSDGMIIDMQEVSRFVFFTYTQIRCGAETYMVHAPRDTLRSYFRLDMTREYRAGEVIARGYWNTGDHVFVDKVTYNFRKPTRGEVFVFKTSGIPTQENRLNPGGPSQFYIKRLAGLPGDELRIDPPDLYVNGKPASEPGLQRVMSGRDGYHGYSNGPAPPGSFGPQVMGRFQYLGDPDLSFDLPRKCYFALGDNSYHSSDSRDWGVVPEDNLMGRGMFVYWPFTAHWGLVK